MLRFCFWRKLWIVLMFPGREFLVESIWGSRTPANLRTFMKMTGWISRLWFWRKSCSVSTSNWSKFRIEGSSCESRNSFSVLKKRKIRNSEVILQWFSNRYGSVQSFNSGLRSSERQNKTSATSEMFPSLKCFWASIQSYTAGKIKTIQCSRHQQNPDFLFD